MSLRAEREKQLLPVFAAFCFFLSLVEFLIPKPLPFFRIGLANLPLLLAVDLFSMPSFFALVLLKVIGQTLLNGTLFSYVVLFSLAGSLVSGLIMYVVAKIPRSSLSYIGIALLGASGSNAVQLVLARFLLFGEVMFFAVVPLLLVGCLSAIALGTFANAFVKASTWYDEIREGEYLVSASLVNENGQSGLLKFFAGMVLLLLSMFVPVLLVRALILSVSLILCFRSQIKIHFISLIITMLLIMLFNLYPPFGKVIFSFASVYITVGALLLGLEKALLFESLVYTSKWMLDDALLLCDTPSSLLSRSFAIFKKFDSLKNNFDPKHPILSLDEILLAAKE